MLLEFSEFDVGEPPNEAQIEEQHVLRHRVIEGHEPE